MNVRLLILSNYRSTKRLPISRSSRPSVHWVQLQTRQPSVTPLFFEQRLSIVLQALRQVLEDQLSNLAPPEHLQLWPGPANAFSLHLDQWDLREHFSRVSLWPAHRRAPLEQPPLDDDRADVQTGAAQLLETSRDAGSDTHGVSGVEEHMFGDKTIDVVVDWQARG